MVNQRARHNSSLLDAHILKPGENTEDIPDRYVIFISENDVIKGNQPIYPVERYVTIGEEKVLFNDGSHILYVNGKYRGDDEIGKQKNSSVKTHGTVNCKPCVFLRSNGGIMSDNIQTNATGQPPPMSVAMMNMFLTSCS